MAYTIEAGTKSTYTAYARLGADDVYAFVKNNEVYVRINSGAFVLRRTIPLAIGTFSNINTANTIKILANGLIAIQLHIDDGITDGLHFELVHYTGSPVVASVGLEPLADQIQLKGTLAVGVVWYSGTNLVHIVWNGFYRTMGTDFYVIKHQTIHASTGVSSAVTHITEETTAIVGNGLMPTVAADSLLLKYSDGTGYVPLASLTITSTDIDGIYINNPKREENFVLKDTGASNTTGIYHGEFYTIGNNTQIRVVSASTVDATTTVLLDSIAASGFRIIASGCHLNADGSRLYMGYCNIFRRSVQRRLE